MLFLCACREKKTWNSKEKTNSDSFPEKAKYKQMILSAKSFIHEGRQDECICFE